MGWVSFLLAMGIGGCVDELLMIDVGTAAFGVMQAIHLLPWAGCPGWLPHTVRTGTLQNHVGWRWVCGCCSLLMYRSLVL